LQVTIDRPNLATEQTMRIGYVLTTLGMGGAERQALEVAEQMERRGHSVHVLVLGPPVREEWPVRLNVTRLDLRRNPASLVAAFRRARGFVHDFRPDLLHSHCFHANLFARLLRLGGARCGVISTIHNVYEGPWPRMLAYRLTGRWADQTMAVSRVAADRFIAEGAVAAERMGVAVNGIDTEQFAPDEMRRVATRMAMAAGESFVWLSAGRLTPAKDYPNLLRAFARVRDRRAEATLWIAGEGSSAYAALLKAQARTLGVEESVRWLGLRRDMAALLDGADGFVLGSAWEGMPLVLGEAMAMEKPVVATDVGGVRELTGELGVLAPAGDSAMLAAAMLGVMDKPLDERRRLGAESRARIEAGFGLDARVDEWEQLYHTVVERGR
jgi:glycosyltransferase involved in cell wall biosynthesis